MTKKIRTRFAPSPTGDLHIGSVRTALFSWLFARHHGGEFLLRIEDTDLERSTEAFTQGIFEGMAWLGLEADEKPCYQSQRMDYYRSVIDKLLQSENAYRCFCSKERLETLRENQMANKEKPRYDGHCRDKDLKDSGSPYVVRFRNPLEGAVCFHDQVYGDIVVQNSELDDLIIARTGGVPTYNLCVVADDSTMGITHVIRGEDHVNNTPRQINILKALGADIPVYAHLPMILGEDGKKLSKRHGAVSVMEFKKQGVLPQALLNYIVRLGWAHGDQEIFSREEMMQYFDIQAVNKSAAAFNYEKLYWLNQHYQKTMPPEEVIPQLKELFQENNIDYRHGPELATLLTVQAERCKTLDEIVNKSLYFYKEHLNVEDIDEGARKKFLKPTLSPVLQKIQDRLAALSSWEAPQIHTIILETAEEFELSLGKVGPAIRVAVTGGTVSPSLDVTIALLGKKRTIARLEQTLKSMNTEKTSP
jgi:glutamyl-tRNA synthetase